MSPFSKELIDAVAGDLLIHIRRDGGYPATSAQCRALAEIALSRYSAFEVERVGAEAGSDLERGFRIGFEHAVAGGEEAGKALQTGKLPLVMYFGSEESRREMIDAVQAIHPHWAVVKIPERRK